MNDYWRGDVRGLYSISNAGGLITLIEPSAAMADDRPVSLAPDDRKPSPKAGFWFRAIRLPGESRPGPDRWAAACHPATYEPGIQSTYVVCEDGIVWRKDLGHGRGIDVYPDDPAGTGWIKVD